MASSEGSGGLVPRAGASLGDVRDAISTPADLVAAWLSGKKATTLYGYRRDLIAFAQFLGDPPEVATAERAAARLLSGTRAAANSLALKWKNSMSAEGPGQMSPATINRRMSALRSMIELAQTLDMIEWSLNVKNVKSRPYRDTRGTGTVAAMAILEHLRKRDDALGRRDAAIFHLLWDLALRKAEIVALDVTDVDVGASRVSVMRKWQSEPTLMTLPASTLDAVTSWLDVRESGGSALFTNPAGERLSVRAVHRMVCDAGAAVGVRAWPHGIRHASITQALEDTDGDLRRVQKFSGHASMDTLMLYDDARRDFQGEVANSVAKHSEKKS